MPTIPLPFITAMLLILILFKLQSKKEPALKPVMMFLIASTIMMVLVGLRWSLHLQFLRQLQVLLASLLPVFAWQCFRSLTPSFAGRFLPACSLVAAVSGMLIFFPVADLPVDLFIACLSLGFGGALILLAWRGPDRFSLSRLSEAPAIQTSAGLAGALLCFSALTDVLVFADFSLYAGRHAVFFIAIAQAGVLIPLAAVLVRVGQSQPTAREETVAQVPVGQVMEHAEKQSEEPHSSDIAEEQRLCQLIDGLIAGQALYRDPDLTLERLARKALIPGRKISQAVNRVQQRNVSQMINSYRIADAQRLLRDSELPVTEIMAESGFRTKSNFNREFLRTTGMNPLEYRQMRHQSDNPVTVPES